MRYLREFRDIWSLAPDSSWLEGIDPVGRPSRGLAELIEGEKVNRNNVNVVLEIGAELGGSTRRFLSEFPNCMVVSVDPWSAGYVLPLEWAHLRAKAAESQGSLLQLFLGFNLPYKERILPLRCYSHAGLIRAREVGIVPDLVYVDGDHTYHGVMMDLILAQSLFPSALIVGDDWEFTSSHERYQGINYSVQKAAKDFAQHLGRDLVIYGNSYSLQRRNW